MISVEHLMEIQERLHSGDNLDDVFNDVYELGRADAIDEFDRICEEARSHRFGVCDADFVIDVIKAKVKEQLKERK